MSKRKHDSQEALEEFEEFEQNDWPENRKADNSMWDDKWDNDEVDADFAAALQTELGAIESERELQASQTGAPASEGAAPAEEKE
mmetsp:Transcript_5320/g.12857  ORF Transcript_5320/g.12857 Transcript_5320/m.12857 type:complete len:85 (+) Transcript_5320:30-284(+)|eukprot:CAMPEP_0173440542 /NCGR_PEP_ID=MMETSP1357-20121228/23107_1 /TAXON_ID=77926 /ORGANISM="Hemiselmis rufescens, Strain PCC563" /LENGTH=84 /DNA_ID=CAMNT_0014406039 /DNA_START=30 /DNA_END=284 /DNA_ORIENTATION=+